MGIWILITGAALLLCVGFFGGMVGAVALIRDALYDKRNGRTDWVAPIFVGVLLVSLATMLLGVAVIFGSHVVGWIHG
jgi:succinate dehydrogenase hydrophobic anchor subunit